MASPTVTNSSTDLNGKTLIVTQTSASITGGLVPATDAVQVGWVLRKSVTVAHAAILTLPTASVAFLTAAGANTILYPLGGLWSATTSAGAYTNINAASSLSLKYADGSICSTFVVNDGTITGATTDNLTQLLGNARLTRLSLLPYMDVDTSGSWGLIPAPRTAAQGVNANLQIVCDNGGSGNFTGGNSANTLKVVLYYVVLPV